MSRRRKSPPPSRRAQAAPSRGLRVAFLILCTAALLLSADLQRLHVNVHTDPDYQAYCAMSARVNCETVAASSYSVLFGLPLSVWGIFGYLALGVLAVWSLASSRPAAGWPWGFLASLSCLAAAASVVLFLISHFLVESVCLVCVALYLVNLALAGISLAQLRRLGLSLFEALRHDRRAVARRPLALALIGGLLGAGLAGVWLLLPPYWEVRPSSGPDGLTIGVTGAGWPWIGAAQPAVEIVEFSDYQCPHCQRGHREMRELVRRYPQQLRLIHRHYPLDDDCNPAVRRPFHLHACDYARLAHCAGEQGKFWEANDLLFAEGRRREALDAGEISRRLGLRESRMRECLRGGEVEAVIAEDLAAGRAANVRGTPTFVLDGKAYPGRIPPEVLQAALESGESATDR